jgi:hypothetical protein
MGLLPFYNCTYGTCSMLLKILPFCTIHKSFCQYRLRRADHAYVTYLMLQRQLSQLNGRKLHHRQASYTFYVWLHIVLYCEYVHSHDFVCLLLVAWTILVYNLIHMDSWKPCTNRGQVCTLENSQSYGEPCIVGSVISIGSCLPLIPTRA